MSVSTEFSKGLIKENPVLRLALGLCPALAVSSSVNNAIGMGVSATFVLIMSNLLVSLIRSWVPTKIRIPVYIVIIATFVTIVEMVMAAYQPALFRSLGIFVPLIVVNCIILGRAEAFASKNGPFMSIVDALGMGTGFTLALVIIASLREVLGNGTWYGITITPGSFEPVLLMMLAPGAFITMGLVLGLLNWMDKRKADALQQEALEKAGFGKTAIAGEGK
ncbi:electron transport complex subunit E [bacterium]|nr:electron transport complex subunit E [bacterium]